MKLIFIELFWKNKNKSFAHAMFENLMKLKKVANYGKKYNNADIDDDNIFQIVQS